MKMGLNQLSMIFVSVMAATGPAFGEDVPFAEPRVKSDSSMASLSDVMEATQLRHIKLWYAIKAKNWKLSNYELGKLADTFDRAAALYQNIPLELIENVMKPTAAMREAISAKNSGKFEKSFAELTNACNACHRAARVGFIVVQTPPSSPLNNQKYSPKE